MNENNKIIKVILADDHAVVRAGIRKFLESAADIQVIAEAGDGAMAIELIGKLQPDVAVLDIQMPQFTGIEVSRQVRANRWSVGVLILTSYDDDPYITAVLKAGANGYVLKTASPEEIINAVRDVHQGKSVLDATILPKVLAQITNPVLRIPSVPLTDRELEILAEVAKGLTNKVIGIQLNISDRTVQGHIARIFEKLCVNSRTEAVMHAISAGLLPVPGHGKVEHALSH